jgi:uncharacterized protein (DUF697 family)
MAVLRKLMVGAGKMAVLSSPSWAPKQVSAALRKILDIAIDGIEKAKFPGAKQEAGKQLEKAGGHVQQAVNTIIKQHTMAAAAQGFVANLGGVATVPLTLPANLIGVSTIQARMVAAIAHLRGYDIDDPKVRAAILMTMIGRNQVEKFIDDGVLPTTPIGVATAPVYDKDIVQQAGEKILNALVVQATGKQLIAFVGKRIPLVGGGVGAVVDSSSTRSIGQYANDQFPSRRQAPTR